MLLTIALVLAASITGFIVFKKHFQDSFIVEGVRSARIRQSLVGRWVGADRSSERSMPSINLSWSGHFEIDGIPLVFIDTFQRDGLVSAKGQWRFDRKAGKIVLRFVGRDQSNAISDTTLIITKRFPDLEFYLPRILDAHDRLIFHKVR